MRQTTLCILVRGDPTREILLGLKKEGFGARKYTGFGGKVEANETVVMAAARELAEETGVSVRQEDLEPVAQLTFLFPANPAWNQTVHVFVTATWDGTPQESREMVPAWFSVDDLPFDEMWQDGAYWLPRILAGQRFRARFSFRKDNETVDTVETQVWSAAGSEVLEPDTNERLRSCGD